ncbi:putative E3 ubiquitin-protein ligase HERC2 [Symbiodinium microadriaticum]|uniref:Putative E3 ubiquitin-protein ligase HERC2 n=1 Tax=Symbiodinium microadriaticum TaxID=2951 RepID=A0A1Q9DN07_SYMMI|nr:putative E3 ubiquitin-protein ligase HERC2 [Symbiodinium microadriaticum]
MRDRISRDIGIVHFSGEVKLWHLFLKTHRSDDVRRNVSHEATTGTSDAWSDEKFAEHIMSAQRGYPLWMSRTAEAEEYEAYGCRREGKRIFIGDKDMTDLVDALVERVLQVAKQATTVWRECAERLLQCQPEIVRQLENPAVPEGCLPLGTRVQVSWKLGTGRSASVRWLPAQVLDSGLEDSARHVDCCDSWAAEWQTALGVGKGHLVDWPGSILDVRAPIQKANLQNGGSLTLHVRQVQVLACSRAFAAILGDGSVVSWGRTDFSAVQDQLKNVQQIQASIAAFAAILNDGSVVTWGNAADGGDSRAVQDQLKNVQQIQASCDAFAAILADGSVVTWGKAADGGDSRAVQDQLKNVQQIQASMGAFAAILDDGSVVTWGIAADGGDSRAVQDQLKNVQQIQASNFAFAAILDDGSVVTWGDPRYGGDSRAVQDQLKNVQQIQASDTAFAAILDDGSVVTWGDPRYGGDSRAVQDQLKNVQHIQASMGAFAAILDDGSVVTWGSAGGGGDSRAVQVLGVHSDGTYVVRFEVGGGWGDTERHVVPERVRKTENGSGGHHAD